jgi:centrosomal protein CEP112
VTTVKTVTTVPAATTTKPNLIKITFLVQLHDKIAEYEQEKFEMQKKHTQEIQEILDKTNTRIAKMESENNQQVKSFNEIVKNFEQESKKLNEKCETLQRGKLHLEQDKVRRTLSSNIQHPRLTTK